jgi:hypothetical protein
MSDATARRDSSPNSADYARTRRPLLIFVGVLITIVLAFWIAFSLHVLAGEWWIRTTPPLRG